MSGVGRDVAGFREGLWRGIGRADILAWSGVSLMSVGVRTSGEPGLIPIDGAQRARQP